MKISLTFNATVGFSRRRRHLPAPAVLPGTPAPGTQPARSLWLHQTPSGWEGGTKAVRGTVLCPGGARPPQPQLGRGAMPWGRAVGREQASWPARARGQLLGLPRCLRCRQLDGSGGDPGEGTLLRAVPWAVSKERTAAAPSLRGGSAAVPG